MTKGLGAGAAMALGLGAAGKIGSELTGIASGASTNNVVNNPTSTSQNTIAPGNASTVALQVKKTSGSLQDLFNALEVNGTDKLVSINNKGHLIVWQGFDALRVRNSDGFREMHFRDGSTTMVGVGEGRFAFLVADRLEPMQINYLEHFHGGALPPGWSESGYGSGPGSAVPLDNVPGGVRQITTGGSANDLRNLFLATNTFSPQRELHVEFYVAGISNVTSCIVLLGLADAEVTDITALPSNMFYFYFNPNDSPYWRAIVRTAGGFKYDIASGIAAGTGKKTFRFECWPAGQINFSSNTIKPFVDGNEFGQPNYLKDTVSTSLPWTTLMRPFFFIQTLTSQTRSLKVDALKAWETEVWRY